MKKQVVDAIRKFEEAQETLKQAEQELIDAVQPVYDDCGNDIVEIMGLIGELPKGFRPTRRMYEKVLRIQNGTLKADA